MWSMVNVLIATLVGIVTARYLGADLRGTLAILLSVAGLSVLVGTLGTNVAIRRRFPQRQTSLRQYLAASAMLFVVFLAVMQGVVLALAAWVDPQFSRASVGLTFMAYGAAFYWSNQLLDLLNAVGKVPLAAATNAFGTAICLVSVATAAVTGGGLIGVGIAYGVSIVAQIGFALAMLRAHLRQGSPVKGGLGGLLHDGVRLLGLNLGQAVTYRADTILIGAISTSHAVGLYAVATTPASVLMLPATALGQVVMNDAANGKVSLRRMLKQVLLVESIVGLLALVGWLVADFVIVLLFGAEFSDAAGVFRVLLLAQLALVPFLVLSRALVGLGSTWRASLPSILGAFTLIAFAFALIPSFGPLGGAWASVAAYLTMSIASIVGLALAWRQRPSATSAVQP